MLDDMIDHVGSIRQQPVWQPVPESVRGAIRENLPRRGAGVMEAYKTFRRLVLPYATGNLHPGFMGWVHGGGNVVGALAEILAGMLNANLGGRDHAPIEIERQVIRWSAEMFGLPREASGLLVTGTSMANMIAVLIARRHALGPSVRQRGVGSAQMLAYGSAAIHGCIPRALDMAGFGTDALRRIPVDSAHRIDLNALEASIRHDTATGARPFMVVGNAGTVDIGATDDLKGMAEICARWKLWFHVDAAFGGFAILAPEFAPLLCGIERADSIGFDFHKWGQVPYDAGCILVRDRSHQFETFAQNADYLHRTTRGLAGGSPWPCDLGPDLSRSFRALKVWMTLKAYGLDAIGGAVAQCCRVARYLAKRIDSEPKLERVAPVPLNIVCFRPRGMTDQECVGLVADVQESGMAAPSTTKIDGRVAIRAAIVNHRTTEADADRLLEAVLR
ncbi:MAG: cytochrome D ubiquinol oxidase subunit I [Acetobacteraceae bacterium]|nr:cytochrome D ubiquinol oxidase subunit I [Acetobacteraceae bacterium]